MPGCFTTDVRVLKLQRAAIAPFAMHEKLNFGEYNGALNGVGAWKHVKNAQHRVQLP